MSEIPLVHFIFSYKTTFLSKFLHEADFPLVFKDFEKIKEWSN